MKRMTGVQEGKAGTEEGEDEKRREQHVTTLDSLQAHIISLLVFVLYCKDIIA